MPKKPLKPEQPDHTEPLLLNLLENQDKHHKLSHDMQAGIIAHNEKGRNEHELLALNSLEKLDQIHRELIKDQTQKIEIINQPEVQKIKIEGLNIQALTLKGDKGDKGDKGEDGKTPQKGQDYFTPDEINQFKEEIRPRKGEHYFTLQEIEDFKKQVIPIKGVHYKDGEDGKTPIKGIDYEDGEDGKDGEDADEKKIVKAILKLLPDVVPQKEIDYQEVVVKVKKEISYKDIKDAPEFRMGGTGYLREITDVEVLTEPIDGYALKWSAAKKRWVPGVVVATGGSANMEVLMGSGTVWTCVNKPVMIIADNQPFYDGVGVDVTGSGPYTLTFVNAPASVAVLHN